MGRQRLGTIRESPSELHALAEANAGSGWDTRLHMLERIRIEPSLRDIDLADELRVNERTIRRWWRRYQDGGLELLLADIAPDLWRPALQSRPRGGRSSELDQRSLLDFLNRLPTTNDVTSWITEMKLGLQSLLRISRVTITINVHLDLDKVVVGERHGRGRPRRRDIVTITQRDSTTDAKATLIAKHRQGSRLDQVLGAMGRGGFPLNQYHAPVGFEYTHAGGENIGTIILWQDRQRPPILESTRTLMDEMRPFLTFLLTDCIARMPRNVFDVRTFTHVVMNMAERKGLTRRQCEVLIPHMLGRDVPQISAELGIAETTVKSHISTIHRRSGCRTPTELFAQYLSPIEFAV